MARWQCPQCGTVVTGGKKAILYAKKAKCPKHEVKVVRAKGV